jgi:hypothetical protein
MPDTSLTDLRNRSKGASQFATLADAIGGIRSAGRLPNSVSDTSVLGYGIMVTGTDPDAMSAWENRDTDAKAWRDEVGRLGFELASMVQSIKARGGAARPSQEMLAAADAGDRQWNGYTSSLARQKPTPAAKPPSSYSGIDDIADGLTAIGKIPPYAPRPFIVGFTYGLLNSAPDFHAAWVGYDEDPKAFTDLMPKAARALSSEIARIQSGPAQATPPLPATPRQLGRLSDSNWEAFKADYADSVGRSGA